MTRAKGGFHTRRRHKKVLKLTKGHFGQRKNVFRRANESMLKALWYATRDRRNRKRDFRRLWIARINAAARQNGISYSRFIYGLKQADVRLDRKILADLAVRDSETFARLAEVAKEAIG